MLLKYSFYHSAWKYISVALVVGFAIGGYFVPVVGLGVIGLMAIALLTNITGTRSFCAGFCPNGRTLSFTFKKASSQKSLPKYFATKQFRRMLCALTMFCVVSLLLRSNGSIAAIGRVFWAIYVASIGISAVAALLWKPRAWCSFCPMGTLQDTIRGK